MLATRVRLGVAGEWLMAAAFLGGTLLVGTLVVREIHVAPPVHPGPEALTAPAVESVPTGAVSVPALTLGPANEIRVGDVAPLTTSSLGSAIQINAVVEHGPLGPRHVRTYDLAGTRFILVVEPFERNGQPRIAAIYLQ